jgi:soluble lytic murein transglycosylase-like protein
MPDGSERVTVVDLSVRFGGAVRHCIAFEISEPEVEPVVLRADGILPGMEDAVRPPPARSVPRVIALTPPLTVPPPATGSSPHWWPLVTAASFRQGLDPRLVGAGMHVEAANRPQARSPKGALGLMQIMPATGARYGVKEPQDLLDPATNIDVGTRYLRDLHRMFDGQMELVLAAYNAGEGAVKRHGNRIPPYRETQDYVRKVLRLYRNR